jgi:hypothetical protein
MKELHPLVQVSNDFQILKFLCYQQIKKIILKFALFNHFSILSYEWLLIIVFINNLQFEKDLFFSFQNIRISLLAVVNL